MMKYYYPDEINIEIGDFFFTDERRARERWREATSYKMRIPKLVYKKSASKTMTHSKYTKCDKSKTIFAFEHGYITFPNKVLFLAFTIGNVYNRSHPVTLAVA